MATTSSKPSLNALKTPQSATYPSELRSPMVSACAPGPASASLTPTFLKREEAAQNTPITPPSAYLDFLRTLSPAVISPAPSAAAPSGASTLALDGARHASRSTIPTPTSAASTASSSASTSPPTSAPATDKAPSTTASSSCSRASSFCHHEAAATHVESGAQAEPTKPYSCASASKPLPLTRPAFAQPPRLNIPPPIPFSPPGVSVHAAAHTPASALSQPSSQSAVSPKTLAAELDSKKAGPSAASRSRRVSVREVVTRTVTYSHVAVDAAGAGAPSLDPAPRGKRRKVE